MTFREKIADWISGGALSETHRLAVAASKLVIERHNLAAARYAVLEAIAAEEKPTSNATVRRMARMAREALK